VEEMDCCGGHATSGGIYHYHSLPNYSTSYGTDYDDCDNPLYDTSDTSPQFVGVANDGFAIYSAGSGDDALLVSDTSADGISNKVEFGQCNMAYHSTLEKYVYVASTDTFPYIIGCFVGTNAGNRQDCTETEVGEVCSCTSGIMSRSDVTTETKRTVDKTTNENRLLVDALLEYLSGEKRRTKRSHLSALQTWMRKYTRKSSSKRDVNDCYQSGCGLSSGRGIRDCEDEATAKRANP
jgi:hypothetical protein